MVVKKTLPKNYNKKTIFLGVSVAASIEYNVVAFNGIGTNWFLVGPNFAERIHCKRIYFFHIPTQTFIE